MYSSKYDTWINLHPEPEFLKAEVRKIVDSLKPNKCLGHDGITNDYIKIGNCKLIPIMMKLHNQILMEGSVPIDWKLSNIIILHKKGIGKK